MREAILTFLEKNSRIDLKELAVILGTDEATVANEIAKMEQEHIICGYHTLIDWDKTDPQIDLMRYTDDARAKEDKLCDDPRLMKAPVVRNGKKATVGYCPEIWATWE